MTIDTKTTVKDELQIFRLSWPSTKVNVGEDYLTYKVTFGWAKRAAAKANDHLKFHNLNQLIAVPSELGDSICIKGKKK